MRPGATCLNYDVLSELAGSYYIYITFQRISVSFSDSQPMFKQQKTWNLCGKVETSALTWKILFETISLIDTCTCRFQSSQTPFPHKIVPSICVTPNLGGNSKLLTVVHSFVAANLRLHCSKLYFSKDFTNIYVRRAGFFSKQETKEGPGCMFRQAP